MVEMDEMFALAQKEEWDALIARLQNVKNTKSLFCLSSNVRTDEQGTLLHIVCSSTNVNKNVVELLLQLAGPELVCVQDPLGHTSLHDAFRGGAPLDVMKLLITPQSVQVKDNLCLTPLDHVCERIIMREERHRYAKNDENDTDTYLWECARSMLQALGTASHEEEEKTMMMHACIEAHSYCPLALRQRIMNRYHHQLQLPDAAGNLPLHIAARTIVDEDEDTEVIQQVLEAYPAAIRVMNRDGNLPLDEAIRAGRIWSNGAKILFETFPEAILVSENHRVPAAHFALVFAEIGRRGSVDSLYKILHGQPELFRRRTVDE